MYKDHEILRIFAVVLKGEFFWAPIAWSLPPPFVHLLLGNLFWVLVTGHSWFVGYCAI